ncbi:MAG: hypothetical protein LBU32_12575 [Clostridiales bacterium]|jgi:hypothetical protein|nr:hypothetical protein [Clostridiales bacterium]
MPKGGGIRRITTAMTYVYTAKNTRIRNGLEKDHAVDARCTGGNPKAICYLYAEGGRETQPPTP